MSNGNQLESHLISGVTITSDIGLNGVGIESNFPWSAVSRDKLQTDATYFEMEKIKCLLVPNETMECLDWHWVLVFQLISLNTINRLLALFNKF